MYKKKTLKYFFLLAAFIVLCSVKSFTQNNAAVIANADTTNFSVNKGENWQLFNSYVVPYGADSIQMEIIVQHTNTINWSQEQHVGKIKISSLRPGVTRTVNCNLITGVFLLKIQTDGKCYLKLVTGAAPTGEPAILPVRVTYKK